MTFGTSGQGKVASVVAYSMRYTVCLPGTGERIKQYYFIWEQQYGGEP
jgi:hypothetical protein